MAKPMMFVGGVVAITVVCIAIYLVVTLVPPGSGKDDCSLLAKQQSATVDIQATVNDLDSVKAKIGVTAGQVREFDNSLKDYALKYETACRDNKRHTISDAEYNCRRDNMDRALSTTRSLGLALEATKSVSDPTIQKDVVLKDLDTIKELTANDFSRGCGSALSVSPADLSFQDHYPERTIEVTNSGNRNVTYTVTDLPEAFAAVKVSGEVAMGRSLVVAIKRAPFPIPGNGPIVFYVKDNFHNQVAVKISVDVDNAQLFQRLASAATSIKPAGRTSPSVEDALAAVAREMPSVTDVASKYFLAAGALKEAASFGEASRALEEVSRRSPDLYRAPSAQLLAGVVEHNVMQDRLALAIFDGIAKSVDARDERTRTTAKIASGALMLSNGDLQAAGQVFGATDVKHRFLGDPAYRDMVALEFKVDLSNSALAQLPTPVIR